MTSILHILKTNIHSEEDHLEIKQFLDLHPEINEWSLDREDIDRVLRIVSDTLSVEEAIDIIRGKGYHCEELPD